MKTNLRPHKVLNKVSPEGDIHALCFTEGPFAYIIFSYDDVTFNENEDQDHLKVGFVYNIHDVPEEKLGFDVKAFEQELGDFLIELLMYGLERDHLGFIDDNETRENNSIKPDSQ